MDTKSESEQAKMSKITILLEELVSRSEFLSGIFMKNRDVIMTSGIIDPNPTIDFLVRNLDIFLTPLFYKWKACMNLLLSSDELKILVFKFPSKSTRDSYYLIVTIPPLIENFRQLIKHFLKKISVLLKNE